MKKIVTILSFVLMSSTVFAGECTHEQARKAVSDFLSKQMPTRDVYTSSAYQQKSLFIEGKELKGNYEVKYSRIEKSDKTIGEIGSVEVHPGTCQLVKADSQSAWLVE
jgi:hypothetical protein